MNNKALFVLGRGSGKNSVVQAMIEMQRTQDKVSRVVKANPVLMSDYVIGVDLSKSKDRSVEITFHSGVIDELHTHKARQ